MMKSGEEFKAIFLEFSPQDCLFEGLFSGLNSPFCVHNNAQKRSGEEQGRPGFTHHVNTELMFQSCAATY